MNDLKNFPKVELHLHLDGSVRVETAAEILNCDLASLKNEMIAPEKCSDLNHYLTKFAIPSQVLQTSENLERISSELVCDLENDGVIYAEIRFAPMKHVSSTITGSEVIRSVLAGLSKGGIKTNLILCMMRGDSFSKNKEVIDLAKEFLGKGVCAVDLAGAEALYPTKDFRELFSYARECNIPYTIHAGEAAGRESILAAIEFGAKRLGHGVLAKGDMQIISLLKEKDILLEICPTSNVQTQVVGEYSHHPVKEFYDLGISLSINTDNRTVSNITLTDEYYRLIKYLNFNINDIICMNIMAIKHSFLSEEEKTKLLEEYQGLLKIRKY